MSSTVKLCSERRANARSQHRHGQGRSPRHVVCAALISSYRKIQDAALGSRGWRRHGNARSSAPLVAPKTAGEQQQLSAYSSNVGSPQQRLATLRQPPIALQRTAPLPEQPSSVESLLRQAIGVGLPLALLIPTAGPALHALWEAYLTLLAAFPLQTKALTGMATSGLGDYLAQRVAHRREAGASEEPFTHDVGRTARLMAYTAVVSTPFNHNWFHLLDVCVMPDAPTSPQAVVAKMVLDQLLTSPIMTMFFFMVMRCCDGRSDDALAYAWSKLGPTLKANYTLWPAALLVNFAFVPCELRVLYCNVVGLAWAAILSTILNADGEGEGQEGAQGVRGRQQGRGQGRVVGQWVRGQRR